MVYYSDHNPDLTPFMTARVSELVAAGQGGVLERRWLPYERISPHLKRAVIAAEDARFSDHDGFDWDALERAARKNLAKGRIAAGGSTITNQLAKNLFLGPERTPWRKLKEAVITVLIEAVMDKRRILEIYLNVIEWGERCYGAEAAARHYFRTGADRLSRQQAALLASIIPNPRYYEDRGFTAHARKKAAVIRERMRLATPP
ncbi:monofunctional biosynthetic peptidoglycan transglycosylase [Endothiovibrio diazotrophicus]